YTLRRPFDSAILGERTFPSVRASGISEDMAMQRALDEFAPTMARALAGDLAKSLFDYGRTIDPDMPSRDILIHVMDRLDASETSALVDLLKAKGFGVSLSAGRAPIGGRPPRESLVVKGRGSSREELFDVLSRAK